MAQNDSFRHVHSNTSRGPASIQIIWLDTDTTEAFWTRAIALQASLHCGSKQYPSRVFQKVAEDYRLEWEAESHAGIHRLGLTFAHSQSERAFSLLRDLLVETEYQKDAFKTWRDKELGHFEYYQNDSDSSLVWWMNGKREYYQALKTRESMSEANLLATLGKPVILSSIGKYGATYFKEQLASYISTRAEVPELSKSLTTQYTQSGTSYRGYTGLAIEGVNPLEAHTLYSKVLQENQGQIKLSDFNWATGSGWITFDRDKSVDETAVLQGIENTIPYTKESLLAFELWMQLNKNQALVHAYEILELWEESVIDSKEAHHNTLIWYNVKPKP